MVRMLLMYVNKLSLSAETSNTINIKTINCYTTLTTKQNNNRKITKQHLCNRHTLQPHYNAPHYSAVSVITLTHDGPQFSAIKMHYN